MKDNNDDDNVIVKPGIFKRAKQALGIDPPEMTIDVRTLMIKFASTSLFQEFISSRSKNYDRFSWKFHGGKDGVSHVTITWVAKDDGDDPDEY